MTALSNLTFNATTTESLDKNKNRERKLTVSESQRNIGAVTFFLDPKHFEENLKSKTFTTNEMWLPIRDITVAPNAKLSVSFGGAYLKVMSRKITKKNFMKSFNVFLIFEI